MRTRDFFPGKVSQQSGLPVIRVGTGVEGGAELMGMKPSGKKATWTEIGVLRIEKGKIVESWYEVDMLSMINQLTAKS